MARPGYWTPGPEVSGPERARRRRFRRFLETYWTARQAWVEACEHETALYQTEVEDYKLQHPPVLFKNYLIETKGQPL